MPTRLVFAPAAQPLDAVAAHVKASVERGHFVVVVDLARTAAALSGRLAALGVPAAGHRIVDAARDPDAAAPQPGAPATTALEEAMRTARRLMQEHAARAHVVVYPVDVLARHHPAEVLGALARYVEATRRFTGITVDYVVQEEGAVAPEVLQAIDGVVDAEVRLKPA